MRPVVVDPDLIAAGIVGIPDHRRLLGLLAYGRWAQFSAILGPAEEATLEEEGAEGHRGGPHIERLMELAAERRAVLAERVPIGTPDDLVLVSSRRIHDEVIASVQAIRQSLPAATANAELGDEARRIVAAITGMLVGAILTPTFGALGDHLVSVAAESSAPIISDHPELAPHAEATFQLADFQSGRPAFAVQLARFRQLELDRYPFSLDDVPLDLLEAALRPQ